MSALELAGCDPSQQPAVAQSPAARPIRQRPEIPNDWPRGKRIVMHATPSLQQSYVVACDIPVPAWNYEHRGHLVTIALDDDAVTSFRRDRSGKTPLDNLAILSSDLRDLSDLLDTPLDATPKTYGELFRYLYQSGIQIIANDDALQARHIQPAEMDPMVKVVTGAEFKRVLSDVDALLPYDEVGVPHHAIFHSAPH